MMDISILSTEDKVSLLQELYKDIASKGNDGDTMLAHVAPHEVELLKACGGAGTINPTTGLPEFKGAVKAVTKVVKTVAPYVASAFGGPWGQALSLGFEAFSAMQQRKQGKRSVAASREQTKILQASEKSKERYSNVQAQRARIQQRRAARIKQGEILAATGAGGLGMTGTAPFIGATGAVGSQLASNIGDINVAEGFASEQSQFNVAAAQQGSIIAQAQASQQGWKDMSTLAGNVGGSFGNIFGTDTKSTPSNFPDYSTK